MANSKDDFPLGLPELDPFLRWSPVPSTRHKPPLQRRYQIVALTPGAHSLEGPNTPEILIGNTLRSTVGIALGESSESDLSEEDGTPKAAHRTKAITGAETKDGRWIPYQEFRPLVNLSLATRQTTDSTWKNRDATNDSAYPNSMNDFSHTTPNEILRYMLESVEEYHDAAYGQHCRKLRNSNDEFLDLLLPQARQVLLSHDYSRTNLLTIGGEAPMKGIYLHILWFKSDPDIFYLYVGQSIQMQKRLEDHQDPFYRVGNPSFHYFIWDRGREDERFQVDEKFVFLAASDTDDPKLLNLLEMWCCLMLQTLTKNTLLKYLPANLVAPYAGKHLNIAIPLFQPPYKAVINSEDLNIFHSDDPLVHQHYASLRRRFYELKFHPSPVHREYYENVMRQRVITRVQRNVDHVMKLLDGIEVNVAVTQAKHLQTFYLSYFQFYVPRKWGNLEDGAPIQVRPTLVGEKALSPKERCPHIYCLQATEKDPASRLEVFVSGTFVGGIPFAGWLQTTGVKVVYQMNTFVDMLEGGTMMQSRNLPRRWISLKLQNEQGTVEQNRWYTDT